MTVTGRRADADRSDETGKGSDWANCGPVAGGRGDANARPRAFGSLTDEDGRRGTGPDPRVQRGAVETGEGQS